MGKHCYKIQLDTMTDVRHFIEKTAMVEDAAHLVLSDGDNYSINASSIMGVLYSLEWNKLYLYSDIEVYSIFAEFIV